MVESSDERTYYETRPDGTKVEYYNNRDIKSKKFSDGTIREYHPSGYLDREILPDGSWKKYGYKEQETLTSRLIGSHHSGKGSMHRRIRRYVAEEQLPNGDYITYYPSERRKFSVSKNGTQETSWYDNNSNFKKSEKRPDGSYVEYDAFGQLTHHKSSDGTVTDYRYDQNGKLIYHAVNGQEDTVKYLAMRKIAERQAKKSEKLRAQNGENGRQTTKKLNKFEKSVRMTLAKYAVERDLGKD